MAFSVQNIRNFAVGSLLIFVILLHSAIQINLSFNRDSSASNEGSSSKRVPSPNRLQKRSPTELQEDLEDLGISIPAQNTATLMKPSMTMTSTPFPTLTTTPESPSSSSSKMNLESQNFPHMRDWSVVPDHLFLKHYYSGNFSFPNEDLCEKKGDLKLLILIASAVDHLQNRNNVRQTWGHYGMRDDVQIAFVIGDHVLSSANASLQKDLAIESDLFGDIIVASFNDTYRSLTLKTLHMLDWTSTFCSRANYFLKTDDDVFLNVPEILLFIDNLPKSDIEQPKIYGHVFSGHYPKRDMTHKHHLNYVIYPYNVTYPNFTSGPAYLMSNRITKALFEEAMKLPFIPLEDVLINGFAATNLNIPRVDVPGFLNEIKNPVELTACQLTSILAGMTDGSTIQISYVWFNYLMGRAICVWRKPFISS